MRPLCHTVCVSRVLSFCVPQHIFVQHGAVATTPSAVCLCVLLHLQVSYSTQQVQELQQQLETAITERTQAAAELAAAAASAADAQGQLASLKQQAAGREQQIKEAADKVSPRAVGTRAVIRVTVATARGPVWLNVLPHRC